MSEISIIEPCFFEYKNEGMVLHTKACYTLQRGKRIYSKTISEDEKKKDTWFEFEAEQFPPIMLLPTTLKRYNCTVEDVHHIYEKMDASYVWQLALMLLCGQYEPEAASAGVRPTFQSVFTFLFISRKTVFDVFINSQISHLANRIGSVLAHERTDHKPTLPKVPVSTEIFELAKTMVPSKHPSFCTMVDYNQMICFKDIFLVPVEYDSVYELVYMVRVVRKEVYDAIPIKPKECIVTLPVLVNIERSLFVLTEEACFFSKDTNTSGKRKNESNKTEKPLRKRAKTTPEDG